MKKLGLLGVVLMSGTALAADGIKIGGFADVGLTWEKDGAPTMGFMVGEGAVYLGKSMGAGEMLLDLPFAYEGGTIAGISSNNITAGFHQAQAYVSWKYDNGFSWKMGQFDSLYRFEGNDSWDRFFSNAGMLAGMVPVTHTGLLVGYKASDALGVHFLVSNHGAQGAQTANADAKFDYGVKVNANTDMVNVNVGALFSAVDATGDYEWTINASAGNKMGALSSTLEFTAVNHKAASKNDMGVGGHFEYAMDESIDLGASIEWKKNVSDVKTLELRVGPTFNMSKDLHVRLAYGYSKADSTDAAQTIGLNAVHRF